MRVPDNDTWIEPPVRRAAMPARWASRRLPDGLPRLRDVVRAQLVTLFGRPDLLAGATPGRVVGLLPTDAPSRRVMAEPAGIAGGVRSLMVQAAHPLAMAGVAEHSRYRAAPLERLAGTSAWVTATAFGSVEAVHAQARRVRAMHRRVRGTHAGVPYRASDPRLLVWVSVALTSSLLATHDLFAPRLLSAVERDRFVAEQARAAALLDPRLDLDALAPDDLPALALDDLPLVIDGLPTTAAQLRSVLASFHDELAVTDAARDAMAFLYRVDVPALLRPAYRRLLDGVAATLPDGLRIVLDLDRPGRAAAVNGLGALLAAMRATTGTSPALRAPPGGVPARTVAGWGSGRDRG